MASPPSALVDAPSGPSAERADVATLDHVYRALLGELVLSTAHRVALRHRGLSDLQIDRNGYRSLVGPGRAAVAQKLVQRFGEATCASVPGLCLKQSSANRWWTLAGAAGLLIPVRNVAGQVVALKVRVDEPGCDGKYRYISSTRHGGPGPGAPVHVPLNDGDDLSRRVVRVTEGELKGDVATALSRMITLSVAGVSCYRSALPILRELGFQTVHLAFDADFRRNKHVARALIRAAMALDDAGYHVMVETWDEQDEQGH